MNPSFSERKALPERIFATFFDDSSNSTPLPLPSSRLWVVGLITGAFFIIMAAIAWGLMASMHREKIKDVFDLAFFIFQACWVLGWSVFVVILGMITIFFFLYRELARLQNGHLIRAFHLGMLCIRCEYDLTKIEGLRTESVAGQKMPDAVRIYFDYLGVKESLGDVMPQAQAKKIISIIQSTPHKVISEEISKVSGFDLLSWIKKMQARGELKETSDPFPVPETVAPSVVWWQSPSSIVLIGANCVPLIGVLFFRWRLSEVMVLFWAESAVIGFYNVLKLVKVDKWGTLFTAPFFIGHYGGFMTGHFLFIYYFFVLGLPTKTVEEHVLTALANLFIPLWPALLALFFSHGVSYVVNFLGQKEYEKMTTKQLMNDPYKRIVIMHLTIIFGGWLIMLFKTSLPALVLLIIFKIVVDLNGHRNEHKKIGTRTFY